MFTNNTKYPTAQQIMEPKVSFKGMTVATMLEWKSTFFKGWKEKPLEEKLTALEMLVHKLAGIYSSTVTINKYGNTYQFIREKNVIEFDKTNPSVISTLHEFRHAINGADEESACRWSVQLFARCFPNSFSKLEFKEGSHLLIRKTTP